jgi:hypothetical protein
MDCLTDKPKISETFESVRKFSFEEKQEALFDEEKINHFLDSILEFKRVFSAKTEKINSLIENIEQITWYKNLDNDSLILINDLISSIRDLRTSLLRQYVSINFIRTKGIAKEEIKKFKTAIDDLKEIASDLESTFFFLPNMENFNETTKELSLI